MEGNNTYKACMANSRHYVLKSSSGEKVVKITRVTKAFYVVGSVEQQFANSRGIGIEQFCRKSTRTSLMKVASFYKVAGVSKEKLHKGLDDLMKSKKMDMYTYKRLIHMTRSCGTCSANRLYYRLKNALGSDSAHLVDGLDFKEDNTDMESSLNDFELFKKTLQAQDYKLITE